ncbi:MAG: SHOCT domain-containing protein [Promicromonosporaceae bacterium]|nr:SHOCT domain-containing protein [Promicromonosporaceae bacterium]
MGWVQNQQARHKAAPETAAKATFFSGRFYIAFNDATEELTIDSSNVNGKMDWSVKSNRRTFPYSAIEDYQMYAKFDEKTSQGAIGAAVGSLIAGPTGMVIGGLARRGVDKSKLRSAGVKIRIAGDVYDIQTMLHAKSEKYAIDATLAKTQRIAERLEAICGTPEVAKLAALLAQGALTQEEFDAAKAKALGL